MSDQTIKPLTIQELFSNDHYVIPIYQRNYDWGEKEVLQLLEDISDYVSSSKEKNYYLGSLVVFQREIDNKKYFETIDGQQRLTTLFILLNVLRREASLKELNNFEFNNNLSYDHRPDSVKALKVIFENKQNESSVNGNIIDVYKLMEKHLSKIIKEKNIDLDSFTDYLLKKVLIMRIPVPQDTDLNHYFEIMNSRGEQLEKHEVLKATLLNYLDEQDYFLFNRIWEACSDMTKYVQMSFDTGLRSILFSENWDYFEEKSFDSLKIEYDDKIENNEKQDKCEEKKSKSINELFDESNNTNIYINDSDPEKEGNDRFGSIINFPNFLLQVLKVMCYCDKLDDNINKYVKLDDKQLLEVFKSVMNSYDGKDSKNGFVKRFIMNLLKMRHLFDCYVIKPENYNSNQGWSLKKLKKYDKGSTNYIGTFNEDESDNESKDIIMLESMFHVSAPTQIYKHWLNGVLYFLYQTEKVEASNFRIYLYDLARAYMCNRYLCDDKTDFETIIYENNSKCI